MKNSLLLLFGLFLLLSCNNDDGDITGPPDGEYRLVELICFCGPPEEGITKQWIFDLDANTLTINTIEADGQVRESFEQFYGRKGNNLILGEGSEFEQKKEGRLLVLTYLDNPRLADDEVTYKLEPF